MEEIRVSVIVPVYNVKEVLKKCVDSILNQTYKNIEIILINDGSSDNSGKICDEYEIKYKGIKVFHQKNSGVSAARNVGIEAATGDYIQFVDSDDYIEPNMIEKLVQAMNDNVHLVICGYRCICINGTNKEIIASIKGTFNKDQFTFFFGKLFSEGLINSPCNKLYRKRMLKIYNIIFDDNLNMGEDLLFNIKYFKICNGITIIDDSLYNYFNSDNSLTRKFIKDFYNNQQMLYSKVREYLIDISQYNENNIKHVETCYINSIFYCLEHLFHKDSNLSLKDQKTQVSEIVFNNVVQNNLQYSKTQSIQNRVIVFIIKHKLPQCLLSYLIIKKVFKNKMKKLFMILRL